MSRSKYLKDRTSSIAINITPMIDIVFQLLIYFMLTTAMIEGRMEINVPEAQKADSFSSKGITIAIPDNDRLLVNEQEVADLDELESILAANPDKQEVVVKGDREIVYKRLISVMDRCKQAGFENISLAVQPQQ